MSSTKRALFGESESGSGGVTLDPLANAKEKARLERMEKERRHERESRGSFQEKVSLTWADRLTQVVPTQGSFSSALSPRGARAASSTALPAIRPKWPHYLVNVWYEVEKVNKVGVRQRRHINLTQHCILSVKGGAAPSKEYRYMDVAQVWLQNNVLAVVRLRSGKQLVFASPIAATIVQQITTRVQVRMYICVSTYS